MAKYSCEGFRSVEARSVNDAARAFARRAAFRALGRRGAVCVLRLAHWNNGGSWAEFSAFLGKPAREGGGMVGHNVTLYVTRCEGGRV
jgi:hypothetical protein